MVHVKTLLTLRVFEILLFEGGLLLAPTHRVQGGLKECSGQYSVLMQIRLVQEMKNYVNLFKKLFFQNVLVIIFYRYHYIRFSSTQIVCRVMCLQCVVQ